MFLFEPQSSLVRIVNPSVIREPFSASSRGPQSGHVSAFGYDRILSLTIWFSPRGSVQSLNH